MIYVQGYRSAKAIRHVNKIIITIHFIFHIREGGHGTHFFIVTALNIYVYANGQHEKNKSFPVPQHDLPPSDTIMNSLLQTAVMSENNQFFCRQTAVKSKINQFMPNHLTFMNVLPRNIRVKISA